LLPFAFGLRMIGPDAPGGAFKIGKLPLMSTGQIWQGRVNSRSRERDFVAASFFEGETDGFEGEAGGFEAS
jgi:hypothetical protein